MRIAVLGPQNTGKSTFITDFLEKFPEYTTEKEKYRDLVEQKGLQINRETTLESQKEIREFLFNQIKNNNERNVIFDRCLIDNLVYTSIAHEEGSIPEWFLEETRKLVLESLPLVDIYFFIPTSVSVSLVDREARDIDRAYIDTVNKQFLKILFSLARNQQIRVEVISGTREERVAQAEKFL